MKQGGTADSGSLFIPPRAQDRTELLALRETAPNHPVVNLLLANTYLRRSDLGVPQRAAETDLQDSKEALSFDPFSAWANLRLSRQALGENRCREAEQYLTRAEARSPYWVEILHLRRDLTKNDGHFCVNN